MTREKSPNDENGMTPLHFAAKDGAHALARSLIDENTFLNARNAIGETPLDLARTYGYESLARTLKEHGAKSGADIDAQKRWDKGDRTLMVAAHLGKFPAMVAEMLAGKIPRVSATELITAQNEEGDSLLKVLYRQDQISSVLTPDLWAGRSGQLIELISHIPNDVHQAINLDTLLSQTRQQSIGRSQRRKPGL